MSPVSFPRRAGLRRPVFITIATAATTAFVMATAGFAEAGPTGANAGPAAPVLVQFKSPSIAEYTGGVAGIAATKPATGGKLQPKSWNYKAYRDHLRAQRASVLKQAKVDGKKTLAELDNTINGVVMKLTGAEMAKLSRAPEVQGIWKQRIFKPQTTDTPKFLGLDGPDGTWADQFGDVSRAGEGVIVGVVDTGITPENPSFAALPEPRPDQAIIDEKWHGECVAGDEAPISCNNKLLGARFYDFGGIVIADRDFLSPRDWNGHGSHTASTAAGNNGVTATINGQDQGKISGMAPAARVAAYKVCWEADPPNDAGCGLLEMLTGIDDAVADGVDVINFSIGGAPGAITDLVEIAFLNAAAAGVFVAASAGNTPGVSTADHNSPWLTTVAASTHDRTFTKSVTLGSGTTFTSAGFGPALPSSPLVDSPSVAAAGDAGAQARLCALGSLDPAKTAGKIVVCERGVVGRTEKSQAVKDAGGIGMIMYNPTPNSLNADFHAVPTVHVGPAEGTAIKAYITSAGAGATASMAAAVRVKARAPQMAAFSASGPAVATAGDLLKPDITAPGVDVIAAVAPPGNSGNNFNALSGTSMSSPHIAGIAALLRSKFPTWSPMAIKSALMTTATQADNTGAAIRRETGAAASPLDYGSGHVRPGAAFNPGLVYDSGPLEWVQFICGAGEPVFIGGGQNACDLVGSIDPSDLNYPSIAVGDLAGKQTVTRTVSNTTNQASVYFPKVTAPAGFTVKVTPPVLVVLPRKSATYKVEITRTTAAFGQFGFGSVTWADLRGHSVRSPIALRAVPAAAPAEVTGTGASGSSALAVRSGFNGTLTAKPFGLVASTDNVRHIVGVNTAFDPAKPAVGPGVGKVDVTVPAGSKVARFQTFGSQYPPGTDLDLFVYKGGQLVGASAGGTSDEQVTVPAASGAYEVFVVQFALPGATEQDVHLHSFVVPGTAAGNLTATPASQAVSIGQQVTVTAAWSGLTAGQRYLGVVEYGNGTAAVAQSIITINA